MRIGARSWLDFVSRKKALDWHKRLPFGLYRRLWDRCMPDMADLTMLLVKRVVVPMANRLCT